MSHKEQLSGHRLTLACGCHLEMNNDRPALTPGCDVARALFEQSARTGTRADEEETTRRYFAHFGISWRRPN